MTLTCPTCNGPVRVIDDNGAEYPETRIETLQCEDCNYEFTNTLTA